MEQTLNGADSSVLFPGTRYYGGAVCGVRWTASRYSVTELNGRYTPQKPVLEAPRAFAQSPFHDEENVMYFGGFDANFHPSTNRAWIFKAGTYTVAGDPPSADGRVG